MTLIITSLALTLLDHEFAPATCHISVEDLKQLSREHVGRFLIPSTLYPVIKSQPSLSVSVTL